MNDTAFTMIVDDKDIEHFGMRLINYETSSYVGRKTKGVDVPGAHGTQEVPSALSTRIFLANVVCTGKDADEVHTRIRQFFAYMYSTQNARKVVFTNDMRVIRYAILDSPERYKVITGIDGAFTQLKLTFLMQDPFVYQNEPDTLVAAVSHGKQIILINEGFECPAIYTIKNITNTQITDVGLVVNGELASFSCNLNAGDVLVLDTNEFEVKLNGNVRLDYWEGEMPMLKNGDNIIQQYNSQEAELLVTIEFTKQWV